MKRFRVILDLTNKAEDLTVQEVKELIEEQWQQTSAYEDGDVITVVAIEEK